MTHRQALIKLIDRAKYAQLKADTTEKRQKAQELVNATNIIIDYYNKAEEVASQLEHTSAVLAVIADYAGIDYSLSPLRDMPINYLRERMAKYYVSNDLAHSLYQTIFDYCSLLTEQNLLATLTKIKQEGRGGEELIKLIETTEEMIKQLTE